MVEQTKSRKTDGAPVFTFLNLISKQGESIDLLPLLQQIEIFEDIYSPVITGSIVINDSVGLFDNLPITGKEKLLFKAHSWNYDQKNERVNFLNRKFDIIRITDIVQMNDYTKRITLHFASPELLKNETLQISKGYSNVTMSDIVEDIMTLPYRTEENLSVIGLGFPSTEVSDIQNNFYSPYLSSNNFKRLILKNDEEVVEFFVEKTKNVEPNFSIPYMSPFDIINWASSRSLRNASGRNGSTQKNYPANFLFFENKRGFNFVSVDTLMEGKEISTTNFVYGSGKQNHYNEARRVNVETIRDIQIQDCHNILKNLRNGVYASKLHSYDIATGQFKTFDYDYIEEFYNTESTQRNNSKKDYPMIPSNDSDLSNRFFSKRMFITNSPMRGLDSFTTGKTERKNDIVEFSGPEDYIQKRLSQLGRLSNYRIVFEIGGNSKHKVGDMANIDIKSPTYKSSSANLTEEENKYYSGYYLITSIRHFFTKFDYKMNIEAVKDSHKEEIKYEE